MAMFECICMCASVSAECVDRMYTQYSLIVNILCMRLLVLSSKRNLKKKGREQKVSHISQFGVA